MRPGKGPSAHAYVEDGHLPYRRMNVQLHPAAALKIKRFKMVDAFLADKAGPTVKVGVQQRGTADLVSFLHHQLDGGACRSIDGEIGPADDLFRELKHQSGATPAVQIDFPLSGA